MQVRGRSWSWDSAVWGRGSTHSPSRGRALPRGRQVELSAWLGVPPAAAAPRLPPGPGTAVGSRKPAGGEGRGRQGLGGLRCRTPCPGQPGAGRLGDPQPAAGGGLSGHPGAAGASVCAAGVLSELLFETSMSLTLSKLKPAITAEEVLC